MGFVVWNCLLGGLHASSFAKITDFYKTQRFGTGSSYIHIQGLSKRFEHLLLWPPRSPDLTPCDFFLLGYVKDNAYKPPLPQNVRELQDRIRAAVQTIDGNMLKCVWQERLSY